MFNLSDILKKNKEEKAKEAQVANGAVAKKTPLPKKEPAQEIAISSVVGKQTPEYSGEVCLALYEDVFKKVKEIYTAELDPASGLDLGLAGLLERIFFLLASDCARKELLRQCLYDYPRPEDYLFYHVFNVSIISLEIGIGLGYEKEQLDELGRAALLHDIGITRYLDIINKPGKLSDDEFKAIKEHPVIGADILSNYNKDIGQRVFDAIRQEHERSDGSGYPLGLKGNEICEYAQILGVADAYEAMIHNRPYRNKNSPLQAINVILSNKGGFNTRMIKVLIERIGIFPVGSKVCLNTKEIGVVIEENEALPLRPVVSIIQDANGKPLKEAKMIDLAGNPVLYIEDCLEYLKEGQK